MRIYTYNIPISTPLLAISNRCGLIIQTEQGFGEAAPLPGWSRETVQDLLASVEDHLLERRRFFRRLERRCGYRRLPRFHIACLDPPLKGWDCGKRCVQNHGAYPSAEFGLKCADQPFPRSFPSIPISALVTNLAEAKRAIAGGFQTLKIKVGGSSVQDALDFVSRVQIPNIQLRIDVNRRWSFGEAQLFMNRVNPEGIEYIEEPTSDLDQLHKLPPLPIALDESLREAENNWMQLANLHAFVLKPTLLGSRLDFLIRLGQKLKKKLVFSSSFESAIGLLHIAHLQARLSPKTAAGLDTHRFFLGNFFPMPVKNGMLCDHPLPPLDCTWLNSYVP